MDKVYVIVHYCCSSEYHYDGEYESVVVAVRSSKEKAKEYLIAAADKLKEKEEYYETEVRWDEDGRDISIGDNLDYEGYRWDEFEVDATTDIEVDSYGKRAQDQK